MLLSFEGITFCAKVPIGRSSLCFSSIETKLLEDFWLPPIWKQRRRLYLQHHWGKLISAACFAILFYHVLISTGVASELTWLESWACSSFRPLLWPAAPCWPRSHSPIHSLCSQRIPQHRVPHSNLWNVEVFYYRPQYFHHSTSILPPLKTQVFHIAVLPISIHLLIAFFFWSNDTLNLAGCC